MSQHSAQATPATPATPAMSRNSGYDSDDDNDNRPRKYRCFGIHARRRIILDSDEESANEETVNDGAVDDGAIDDGAVDDGAVDDGAIDDGAVDDGAVDDGAVDDGAVDDRPPELVPSVEEIRRSFRKLRRILASEAGKFIPTANQLGMLAQKVKRGKILDFSRLSNQSWHDALWADNGGILFNAFNHAHPRSLFADQMTRARYLVQLYVQNSATQIVLMDGHGRFLLCLIHALIEQGINPNAVVITFVDIDEHADSWHQAFFPRDTYATRNDVLKLMVDSYQHYIVDESDADPDLPDLPDPRSTIFYLNFCAVSDAIANFELTDGKGAFIDLLVNYADLRNTMFSYFIRGMSLTGYTGRTINRINNRLKLLELVCSRGKFCTAFVRR